MIKPEELQLGNFVLYKGHTRVIESINYHWFKINGPLQVKPHDCQGAPINPSMLRFFGFEEISEGEFYKVANGHTEVFVYKDGDYDYRIGKTDADIEIRYIHQLQNSYLLLTKVPLTAK